MPVYETQIPLSSTAERLFDFLSRPANLAQLSPPAVQLTFVDPPEVISLGSEIVFKIQVFGQVQQFVHEIVAFERPNLIRENAIATPMKSWTQEYQIEPADGGLVTLTTRIEFEPPGGMLGFILTPDRIIANLKENHEHRRDALQKALQ